MVARAGTLAGSYPESRVFAEIQKIVIQIPRGRVATYGRVAEAAGFPGAARQVAWALRNSDGRLPWHRVLGAQGRVLLPGEAGLEQRLRLKAEGVKFQGDRADLSRSGHSFEKVPGKIRFQKSTKSS